jgi:serine/threonine protein kinase
MAQSPSSLHGKFPCWRMFHPRAKSLTFNRKLNHPNIIRFFGVHISQGGQLYMVMEYLPSGSLLDKIRSVDGGMSMLDKLSMLVFSHSSA